MLSFSHGSIAIRGNGFVAHVNAIPPARATPAVSSVGNIRTRPRRPITQMPATAPRVRATSSTIAPGRVESTMAPPGPARRMPAAVARPRDRTELLSRRPAVTRLRPAATGTSLKLTWDVPSHSGVARMSDQANAPARAERRTIASAAARAVTATTATIRLAIPW